MSTAEQHHTGAGPTVTVDGHPVGLTVTGSGDPIVVLHGIGRDRTDWFKVAPGLAEQHTVYAIDIEAFGESEPWSERTTLASMAQMVRRTLEEVGEHRPVVLVGNSMGGAVALRMHADDPGQVRALVLVSPAGFGADASLGLRLMTVPVLGEVLQRCHMIAATMQVRALFADAALATRELAESSARRMRRPGARRHYLQVIRDLGAWSGVRPEWRQEVLEALAAAGTPTMVLWGDRDVVLPHRHLDAVSASVPHAVPVSLPGLGHAPQLEDPDRFLALVGDFVDGLGAGRF
ncbi:MAG TPA: alpha/beta fold hydrolase [Amnibacterium sp.]|jgi:pimeloyl-ACP methyl ester carboxylesterase